MGDLAVAARGARGRAGHRPDRGSVLPELPRRLPVAARPPRPGRGRRVPGEGADVRADARRRRSCRRASCATSRSASTTSRRRGTSRACPDDRIAVDADGFFTDRRLRPRSTSRRSSGRPTTGSRRARIRTRSSSTARCCRRPDFAEAIERAPSAEEAPRTTGAYYPDTRICTAARFDADRCGLPVAAAPPAAGHVDGDPCGRAGAAAGGRRPPGGGRAGTAAAGQRACPARARSVRVVSAAGRREAGPLTALPALPLRLSRRRRRLRRRRSPRPRGGVDPCPRAELPCGGARGRPVRHRHDVRSVV